MEAIEKDLKYWKAKFKIARVSNVPKDYHLAAGMCDGLSLALKRITEKNNKEMQTDSNRDLCLCPELFGDCKHCYNGKCVSPLI